jgi:hypothetical protein
VYPLKPSIRGIPSDKLGIEGTSMILTCVASGSIPVSRLEWTTPLGAIIANATYNKDKLDKADAGNYSCAAVNRFGKTKSENFTLAILGKLFHFRNVHLVLLPEKIVIRYVVQC